MMMNRPLFFILVSCFLLVIVPNAYAKHHNSNDNSTNPIPPSPQPTPNPQPSCIMDSASCPESGQSQSSTETCSDGTIIDPTTQSCPFITPSPSGSGSSGSSHSHTHHVSSRNISTEKANNFACVNTTLTKAFDNVIPQMSNQSGEITVNPVYANTTATDVMNCFKSSNTDTAIHIPNLSFNNILH